MHMLGPAVNWVIRPSLIGQCFGFALGILLTLPSYLLLRPAGSWTECSKIIDLRPGSSAEFVAVGCIYKDQPLKPSVLDEYR